MHNNEQEGLEFVVGDLVKPQAIFTATTRWYERDKLCNKAEAGSHSALYECETVCV